jgi:hypothetical protein
MENFCTSPNVHARLILLYPKSFGHFLACVVAMTLGCAGAIPAGAATVVKVVSDTYTRANSSNLGTTEDASHITWTGVGAGTAVPGITNGALYFVSSSDATVGSSGGDVGLGAMQAYLAGYKVKNLRMEVNFTPHGVIGPDDKWVALQWRKSAGNGGSSDGYMFLVKNVGWWSILTNGTVAVSGWVAPWTNEVTHTLTVVATNSLHTVYYDGQPLTNFTSSYNPNAGYASLITYHFDTVAGAETFSRSFDDFTLVNDDVFRVEDYGTGSNWGPAIRTAISAAKSAGAGTTVLFESPGAFTVTDHDPSLNGWYTNYAIGVLSAKDLTIHANGSTLLVSNNPTMGGFYFQDCSNAVIRGITLDYNPLPFTQGRITAVNTSLKYFDLQLDAGYPSLSNGWFLPYPTSFTFGMIMDPTQRLIKANVGDAIFITNWVYQSGTTFRITPNVGTDLNFMTAGSDRFVYMLRRTGFGVHHRSCTNCTVDDVAIYSSPSLALTLQLSTGQVYNAIEVTFGPDIGAIPRLMTAGADGLHCQNNLAGPNVTNCLFQGLPDDALTIYVLESLVVGVNGNVIDVGMKTPMRVGDRIQVFNPPTGLVRGETDVAAVTTVNVSGTNYYRVTLATAVSGIAVNDHLYNLNYSGEGFSIRNNTFLGSRRYGLLLMVGNGTIQNNAMTNMGGGGIVLRNEVSVWVQGAVPKNVTVLNNTLDTMQRTLFYKHEGAISAYAYRLNGGIATQGYGVTNIVLTGNKIMNSPLGIFIGAATNVTIASTTITNAGGTSIWDPTDGIVLERVGGVKISGTSIQDTRNDNTKRGPLHAGIHIKHTTPNVSGTNGVYIGTGMIYNLPHYTYPGVRDER